MLIGKFFKDGNCVIHEIISVPVYDHILEELVVVVKNSMDNKIKSFPIDGIGRIERDTDLL